MIISYGNDLKKGERLMNYFNNLQPILTFNL